MTTQSPIELKFKEECDRVGIYFDVQRQVSRYRVDFIDKSRKLIVEVDGHEYHKTKEDRTYDARRDRQLQRDGFTVLRFTGTEIYSDVARCVAEVGQTIALMEPQPTPRGALYIDWIFFDRSSLVLRKTHEAEYPDTPCVDGSLSGFLDFIEGYLHLAGRYDVHLFGAASSFSNSIVAIDALKLRASHLASFNVTEHQNDLLAIALVEHLHKQGTLYDELVLVADDPAYEGLLTSGREFKYLLRRNDDDSSMLGINAREWQDIDYVLGSIMGIPMHEL